MPRMSQLITAVASGRGQGGQRRVTAPGARGAGGCSGTGEDRTGGHAALAPILALPGSARSQALPPVAPWTLAIFLLRPRSSGRCRKAAAPSGSTPGPSAPHPCPATLASAASPIRDPQPYLGQELAVGPRAAPGRAEVSAVVEDKTPSPSNARAAPGGAACSSPSRLGFPTDKAPRGLQDPQDSTKPATMGQREPRHDAPRARTPHTPTQPRFPRPQETTASSDGETWPWHPHCDQASSLPVVPRGPRPRGLPWQGGGTGDGQAVPPTQRAARGTKRYRVGGFVCLLPRTMSRV